MCHPLVTPTCQECDSCTCDIVKNVPPKYYCILTVKIDPTNIILPSLFLTNVNVKDESHGVTLCPLSESLPIVR